MMEKSGPITDKMADLLVDMICMVDEEGNYVYVSAASEKLLGYTPDEMLGRNMFEFMHPDDKERTLANVREVMAGKHHNDFENRYIHRDGRVVDIMWSARWSEEDGVRLAVARDVTASKRAARRQETLYRISEAAQSSGDLPTLLRAVHRAVEKLLPGERFIVALTEPGGERVWFPFFYDGGEREQEPAELSEGMHLSEVIRGGRGVIANSGRSAREDTGSSSGNRTRDWIGAPIASPAGVMGAVVMQRGAMVHGYSDEDLELLQFMATQLALAIERKRQEERLRYMAHHDSLTNLPNRALFRDRVETALRRARREKEMLALLFLDLRDFKDVNDVLGHAVGDTVLAETARRLAAVVRDSDTVARLGGDEFTVLAANIHGRKDVDIVAARLRKAVAEPLEVKGESVELTVDIGAAFYPEDGEDAEALLCVADMDMYRSKSDRLQARVSSQGRAPGGAGG